MLKQGLLRLWRQGDRADFFFLATSKISKQDKQARIITYSRPQLNIDSDVIAKRKGEGTTA